MSDPFGIWSDIKLAAVMLLIVAVVGGGIWVGASYFEAKAFNRITGAHVTTWDAMWVSLRVQEGAKR